MANTHTAPSTREIAHGISHSGRGTSHDPHANHAKDFSKFGVSSRQDFQAHLEKTMNDPKTRVAEASKGRTFYHNRETQTFITHDPGRADKGSAYKANDKYFTKKIADEKALLKREPLRVEGGHDAYHTAKHNRDAAKTPQKSDFRAPTNNAKLRDGVTMEQAREAAGNAKLRAPAKPTATGVRRESAIGTANTGKPDQKLVTTVYRLRESGKQIDSARLANEKERLAHEREMAPKKDKQHSR